MLTLTPLVKETHSVQKIHAVPQSHSHSSKRVPGKAGWGPGYRGDGETTISQRTISTRKNTTESWATLTEKSTMIQRSLKLDQGNQPG